MEMAQGASGAGESVEGLSCSVEVTGWSSVPEDQHLSRKNKSRRAQTQ